MEIRVVCQVPIAPVNLTLIHEKDMEKAAIVAAARKRPAIFRALRRSLIHTVAIRTLTTKLSWEMGVTTLTSALPSAR